MIFYCHTSFTLQQESKSQNGVASDESAAFSIKGDKLDMTQKSLQGFSSDPNLSKDGIKHHKSDDYRDVNVVIFRHSQLVSENLSDARTLISRQMISTNSFHKDHKISLVSNKEDLLGDGSSAS